jgi:hypothetical protein
LMIILTVSLSIFFFRKIRKVVFDFLDNTKILDNQILKASIYISFVVIGIILVDSVWTYSSLSRNL